MHIFIVLPASIMTPGFQTECRIHYRIFGETDKKKWMDVHACPEVNVLYFIWRVCLW